MIIDSQVHIWEVDRPDRPWPAGRNTPQLPDGFGAEQMLAEMDAIGVDRAVIVPPTWVGENNSTALEAAAAYPDRFAVMGRFDPLAADAAASLEGWLSQPGMLGIRFTFRIPPYDRWLDGNTLTWFWRDAERLGIPVMVLVPGLLDKLQPIAARHPGLRLIIDHMGCEPGVRGPRAFERIDDLLALAAHDNVYVKTSSAPAFSTESYPFADLLPYLRRIYDAFGARRMLWGADLTRLGVPYAEGLRHFTEGLDFLSEEDKTWALGRSAVVALNWPES